MEINKITELIIGCAIEVHKQLGPGLLESTYEACLYYELIKAGINVQRQVPMPLIYKEVHLEQVIQDRLACRKLYSSGNKNG